MGSGKLKKSCLHKRNQSLTNQIALGAYEFLLLVFRTASAHGLSHIAARKRSPMEIIVWILAVLVGISGAAHLCQSTWERYQSSPTVISLERNYLDWNTTFPASTVCPLKKLEDSRINKLAREIYWKNNSWNTFPLVNAFKGNPLEGDIFVAMMEMNSDLQVFIHSPQEIPESASKWFLSAQKHYLALEFEALAIYSTENTRELSVKQRKCRFLDESNLETSPVYSYNMCRSECRMRLAFKLCSCVPYFYRNIGKYRICDVAGMRCLSQYKERLIQLRDSVGNKHRCDCYPTCNEINYIIQTDSSIEWLLGTNFKYTLIKYPRSRLKRDIVFGASDLLVQFGGTVGLCLGCSILSIVEIFYFFTLRLYLFIMDKTNHH
ncbi:unnamed protein product [Nezara viridula]|uniref:Uncharacterized protein n=1 Tax=Nezara viridula TaxID=85310 RepID=A0A9P0H5Z0_NEZVI|nr:unnamed protein product [Nezara viridula]